MVLKVPHLNQVRREYNKGNNGKAEEEEDEDAEEYRGVEKAVRGYKESGQAFHGVKSGEKHHGKRTKDWKKKNLKYGNQYQTQYQYRQHGQHAVQQGPHKLSASEQQPCDGLRSYETTSTRNDDQSTKSTPPCKTIKARAEPAQPEPMLLPKGHAGASSSSVNERRKHPRLNGADLYVARLGWCKEDLTKSERPDPKDQIPDRTSTPPSSATANLEDDDCLSRTSSTPSAMASSTGSLHDELINPTPSPSSSPEISLPQSNVLDTSKVRASRPCYRCISYMHSVGVKRVFWTNDAGEWEGGKVRDLVDALDGSMEAVAEGKSGPLDKGVFVTKHEVLMLKRMMGEKSM